MPQPASRTPNDNNDLVQAYGDFVLKFVRVYSRKKEPDEDLVQHVWLKLFETNLLEKYRQHRSKSTFRSYLQWTIHNIYSNWVRTKARKEREEAVEDAEDRIEVHTRHPF